MSVTDIAAEIFDELDSSDSTSVPAIAYWLRNNIGILNNLLFEEFTINGSTYEISPELTETQKVIFKKLYFLTFYEKKIRGGLTQSSTFQITQEITSDGATVRRASVVQVLQQLKQMRNDLVAELKDLINTYRLSSSRSVQVSGDDVIVGLFPINKYNRLNDR